MNTSGMKPINLNVLIRPDEVEDKTKGGLYIPDDARERDEHAQTRGTLIAMCPDAFGEMGDNKPVPGQRVIYAKYEGVSYKGDDGLTYRLVKDVDVVGVEDSAAFAMQGNAA